MADNNDVPKNGDAGPNWPDFLQGVISGAVSNNPATYAVNTAGSMWNLAKAGVGYAGHSASSPGSRASWPTLTTEQMPELADMSKIPMSSEWMRSHLEDNPESKSGFWGNMAGGLGPLVASGLVKGAKMIAGGQAKNAPPMGDKWFDLNGRKVWEFSDQNANLKAPIRPDTNTTLGQVLDHPELFKNYPRITAMPVKAMTGKEIYQTDSKGRLINGGGFGVDPETKALTLWVNPQMDPAQQRSTMLHEITHKVQHSEWGSAGSSLVDAKDKAVELISKLETLRKTDPEKALATAKDVAKTYNVPLSSLTMEKELGDFANNQLSTRIYYQHPGETEARAVQARRNYPQHGLEAVPFESTVANDTVPVNWADVKKRFPDLGLD